MQMITELEVVPHTTVPGRKIKVKEYQVRNFYLHTVLTHISRMILGLIESRTNNMKGEVVPRTVTATRLGWEAVKATFQFALDHNNPPTGAHEFGYAVLLPTKGEIQRIPNIKTKMIVQHLDHLAEIVMSCDSANSDGNIGVQSEADLREQISICEDAIDIWFGGGADNSDVGQTVAILKHLGELRPDVDLDKGTVYEPSADRPQTGRPDVADVLKSE